MATPQPSSRTLSWRQMVLNADPNWTRDQQRPIKYQFSNGREFVDRPDTYTTPGP